MGHAEEPVPPFLFNQVVQCVGMKAGSSGPFVCTMLKQGRELLLDDAVQPVPSEGWESNELDAKLISACPTDLAQFDKQ